MREREGRGEGRGGQCKNRKGRRGEGKKRGGGEEGEEMREFGLVGSLLMYRPSVTYNNGMWVPS